MGPTDSTTYLTYSMTSSQNPLEVSPSQAEVLQRAVASGNISLALRSIEDSNGRATTGALSSGSLDTSTVVRFGVVRAAREIAGR